MDALAPAQDALIDAIAFKPLLHFQLQLGAGMCMEIASRRRAPLYVVGQGGARLRWEDAPPVTLHAGDVAFLPRAGRHRLCSDERAPLQRFEDLLAQGYVRDAIINFIALLGWSPGDEREFFTLDELVQAFDLKGLSKAPAIFNTEKLVWFNHEYICCCTCN